MFSVLVDGQHDQEDEMMSLQNTARVRKRRAIGAVFMYIPGDILFIIRWKRFYNRYM